MPRLPLGYGAMRLRWCGLALRAFIRRWGVYGVVTAAVLSAGASGWEQVLQAIAAALVLPLFSASQQGWWLLPATLAQALMGAAAVWAARSLLWPPHWAESERALPLPPGQTLRSDLLVVSLVLTPLMLFYLAGTVSVLAHRPAWLAATQGRALLALVLASVLSLGLGTWLLNWQRGYRAGASLVGERLDDSPSRAAGRGAIREGALSAPVALILLPLWRGPARRTGMTLLLGSALLLLAAALPVALLVASLGGSGWVAGWSWLLAAWSVMALLVATRIHHLARLELTDMLLACSGLPVNLRRLHRMRSALGLLPLLPGLVAVLGSIAIWPPAGLRPGVLLTWALACVLACVVEVFAHSQQASGKAARWWFSLILCVCLASEVLA